MENLTDEQQKRIALLEAFEAKTAPERDIRNAGIDQHEQEYREKWLQLQSSLAACNPLSEVQPGKPIALLQQLLRQIRRAKMTCAVFRN